MMRRDVACIFVCFAVSLVAISAAAFQGLNGSHTWRQADVYSQLLGVLDRNQLSGLVNFFGETSFYDVPVYQYLVATLSKPFTNDVLAFARVFNAVTWLGFLFVCVAYAEKIMKGSGKYYALLLCTSQILVHYFSTPLPDVFACTLCMLSLFLLHAGDEGLWQRIFAIFLFVTATAIKSPVAFVFFVFFVTKSAVTFARSRRFSSSALVLTVLLPPVAICAELLRKAMLDGGEGDTAFARPPEWYFGDLAQRLSADFWAVFAERNLATAYLSPWVGLLVCIAAFVLFFVTRMWRDGSVVVVLSSAIACLSGWLVFSNLYFHHDYYYIPGVILLLLTVAVIFAHAEREMFGARVEAKTDYVIAAAAVLALPFMVFQSPLRDLNRVSQYEVLGFMLAETEKVLLVHDTYVARNPSFGGFVERPFKHVTSEDFLGDAVDLSKQFNAIVVHESSAKNVVEIDGFNAQTIGSFVYWARSSS